MPDQKPPRLVGDERETLLALLRYQRESLARKCEVADADARWSPVASGTSLLWLLKHTARAETTWFARRFAGDGSAITADAPGADDTVDGLLAAYRAACARSDEIIAAADLDEPCRETDGDTSVNLRWVIAHMLEETARHAGHADIIREQLDSSTGR